MKSKPFALVTGGAHRLGRECALCLARQGFSILLHYYKSKENAKQTSSEIKSLGSQVHLVQCNLTSDDGIDTLFETLDSILLAPEAHLRVLVNSAAVMQKDDIKSTDSKNWDATFALNLRAPFLITKQAAKRMGNGGIVINISDVGAQKLWTNYPSYVSSKYALDTLTRLQAKTYAPAIRVNAISPGLVFPSGSTTPAEWEKLVRRLPLKKPVSLKDLNSALEFLIKNESVTGQTLVIDGGFSLL
jgi:NAD(P)-dependent dehydrogenase (short-subunit alcohol dehydrogenase family)